MDSLIPGLFNDLGRECLIRIPFYELPTAISVSKAWNSEIKISDFHLLRKLANLTRPVIVLAQANINDPNCNSGQELKNNPSRPAYRLTMSDPETGFWAHLPEIPGLSEGLPVFSGLVGCGSDLIVIGGWDSVSLQASSCVYVYSFISGKWRRGSDMPGVRRSFFGCGSDYINRRVVVAGGHDEDKNALKSALIYDVGDDKWTPLADMEKERDECKVIFQGGKFHVISGYSTDSQGNFERTTEVFYPDTWQWCPMVEDFLEVGVSPSVCVVGCDSRMYACGGPCGGDLVFRQGDKWQTVAKVPADVGRNHWTASYGDNNLVIMGSLKIGELINAYVLNLKDNKWSKINIPKEYCGHVQSGCVLEL